MQLQQLVMLGLLLSIVLTVFGFGLHAAWDDVSYVVRRPGMMVRSVLAMIVIMPLVAAGFRRAFDLPFSVEIALFALAISPVPPLLPRRASKGGGYAPFAIGLMATAALLSLAIIPLAVALLGEIFGRPFHIGVGTVALKAVGTGILPLLAGVAVRAFASGVALRLAAPVAGVSTVLLAICALAVLATSMPAIWALIGNGTLLALTGFVVVGLLVGHVVGGAERDDKIVLALCTACRHPAIALTIAATNFPDERLGPTILLYLIVTTLVGAAYLAWQRHVARAVPVASPAPAERVT